MLDKQTLALVITFLIAGTALGFALSNYINRVSDGDDDKSTESIKSTGLRRAPVRLKGGGSGVCINPDALVQMADGTAS